MGILSKNQKNILSTDKKNLIKLVNKFNKISKNFIFNLSPYFEHKSKFQPNDISYVIDIPDIPNLNNIIKTLNKIHNILELYNIIKRHKLCYIFQSTYHYTNCMRFRHLIIYDDNILNVDEELINEIYINGEFVKVLVTRYIFTNYCQSITELKINPKLLKNKKELEFLENTMKLNYIKSL